MLLKNVFHLKKKKPIILSNLNHGKSMKRINFYMKIAFRIAAAFVHNQESMMTQPSSVCVLDLMPACGRAAYICFYVFFYVCKQHSLT